ncbi:unnamed protein product, partial [Mesorhabditis spiculigera]
MRKRNRRRPPKSVRENTQKPAFPFLCLPTHAQELIAKHIDADDIRTRFRLARCCRDTWAVVANAPRSASNAVIFVKDGELAIEGVSEMDIENDATVSMMYSNSEIEILSIAGTCESSQDKIISSKLKARELHLECLPQSLNFLETLMPRNGYQKLSVADWRRTEHRAIYNFMTDKCDQVVVCKVDDPVEWLQWHGKRLFMQIEAVALLRGKLFIGHLIVQWLAGSREIFSITVTDSVWYYCIPTRLQKTKFVRADGLTLLLESGGFAASPDVAADGS